MTEFILGILFLFCMQACATYNYIERDNKCVKDGKDPIDCNQMINAPAWEKYIDIGYYELDCYFARNTSMHNTYCKDNL